MKKSLLAARVNDDLLNTVSQFSEDTGLTRSDIIILALTDYLELSGTDSASTSAIEKGKLAKQAQLLIRKEKAVLKKKEKREADKEKREQWMKSDEYLAEKKAKKEKRIAAKKAEATEIAKTPLFKEPSHEVAVTNENENTQLNWPFSPVSEKNKPSTEVLSTLEDAKELIPEIAKSPLPTNSSLEIQKERRKIQAKALLSRYSPEQQTVIKEVLTLIIDDGTDLPISLYLPYLNHWSSIQVDAVILGCVTYLDMYGNKRNKGTLVDNVDELNELIKNVRS